MNDDDYRTYSFTYRHDGASWALRIKASSPEDAMRRIVSIRYATYDGPIVAVIPVPKRAVGPLRWLLSKLGYIK